MIVQAVEELGLDGIDLVQEQGYGTQNMAANDETSMQLYFIQQLRQKMPNKIISYTFPAANYKANNKEGYSDNSTINFPFRDVATHGHQYLNTINVFRADLTTINELMYELQVPKSKVRPFASSRPLIHDRNNFFSLKKWETFFNFFGYKRLQEFIFF